MSTIFIADKNTQFFLLFPESLYLETEEKKFHYTYLFVARLKYPLQYHVIAYFNFHQVKFIVPGLCRF